jgi:hypothetical protein
MIEYATAMSEKVGSGSSRVAFKIPYKGRDTVLKVAKNKKGIAQNKEEMQYLYDDYIQEMGIVIPIIDHDSDLVKNLTDLFHQCPEIGHGDLKRIANWDYIKVKLLFWI